MARSRIGGGDGGRALERLFGAGAIGGLDDAELLDRFANGDAGSARAAFEAIVERHGPMVRRACRATLRDPDAADDAFQATFLVLARRAPGLDRRGDLGPWLFGVALRVSRKARTASARRAARDRAAAILRPEAVVGPSPADLDAEYERARILHEEVGRLPGSCRPAVVACYFEGLTQAQAAARLGLSEGAIRGRLARARRRLGERLARRGVAPGPAGAALARLGGPCPPLADATVASVARAALDFARIAGAARCLAVSSTPRALAEGFLWSTIMAKTKTWTIAVATGLAIAGIALAGAGAGAGYPSPQGPKPAPARPGPNPPVAGLDADLMKRAPGRVVRTVPIVKDQMILAYMPGWSFGRVDNIGVGNPDGGNRTLIDWQEIPGPEASDPGLRFVLALYSRKTEAHPPAGPLVACEVLGDWGESTSWKTRPRYNPEPIAQYRFEPGDGWKLFDVTGAVRARAGAPRRGRGVLLRFLAEESSGNEALSQYMFVSREGAGEWSGRRPVLLVVEAPRRPGD